MTIVQSEEDDCYLVGFPDFPGQKWRIHGETYETAVNNGVEVLESLMIAYEASGESLPEPKTTTMQLGFDRLYYCFRIKFNTRSDRIVKYKIDIISID